MPAFKTITTVLVIVAVFAIWFFLIVISGLEGSPHATGVAVRLAVLPVLSAVPLLAAIHASGEKKEKKQGLYSLMAIFLPLIGGVVLFWSEISEPSAEQSLSSAMLATYRDAKNHKDKDPLRAYLTCLNAEPYHRDWCGDYLSAVSDPSVCKNLCKVPISPSGTLHPDCVTEHKDSLALVRKDILAFNCAQVMIVKVNPENPINVCKHAGLMNLKRPEGFWQGFYIDCLKFNIQVHAKKNLKDSLTENRESSAKDSDAEFRTLAELLSINVDLIPISTKKPLPE